MFHSPTPHSLGLTTVLNFFLLRNVSLKMGISCLDEKLKFDLTLKLSSILNSAGILTTVLT